MTDQEVRDREAIRHTLVCYSKCGDADDADGFADCFTEDGSLNAWIIDAQGREAIRAWKANSKAFSHGRDGASSLFRVHHLAESHIAFTDADHARVRTPWLAMTDIGPDHSGLYHDRMRRDGERWRIERRDIEPLWRSDASCVDPGLLGPRAKKA